MAAVKKTRGERERERERDRVDKSGASGEDLAQRRRKQRVEALKLIAGIWADRADIPRDGLEYQRMLRSE